MINLLQISSIQLHRAARLKEKIEDAQADFQRLLGNGVSTDEDNGSGPTPRQRRYMSPAAKARLSKIAKARWRAVHRAGRTGL